MSGEPLIAGFAHDAPIGLQGGRVLHARVFIAAARSLAARLPDGDCGLLLCQDRLAFALGFAAMALRRASALLPPGHVAHAIERIVSLRTPAFALVDRASDDVGSLPLFFVDPWAPSAPADEMPPTIESDHVAAVVYTSGTTGDPKPHAKTWSSLVRGAQGLARRVGFLAGDAIVGAVPPQHMWGLEATIMLALQSGGILHPGVPLLPHDIAAALGEVSGRRWLVLTPLHIRSCVQANLALPPLAGSLSATSALERDAAQRFGQVTRAPVIEIYGSTETGVIATRRPAQEIEFTPLSGLAVESGAQGLVLRGAHLDEAVRLGDRVDVAAEGTFTLAGRDADLVKVGGKRASLAMLDRELRAIHGVEDGAFVTVETKGLTPRLAALVVAPSLTGPQIVSALRERVDAVFLPRPLHLVDALPRDAMGKLPLEALRRRVLDLSARASVSTDASPTFSREFVVPSSHPALPGHFPDRPIVPAAWLLTLVATACREAWGEGAAPTRLDRARFRAPLAPDTVLCVRLERHATGRVAFECVVGTTRVADGVFTPRGHDG